MGLKFIGTPLPEVLQRPRCGYCDKRMRPVIVTHYGTKEIERKTYVREETEPGVFRMVAKPTGDVDKVPGDPVSREWLGQYHGYGSFCTLKCCEAFANAAYRAGYRIKR